ncbi:PQQ-dependent sugar dehydrogenase [Devosia sp. ZB163]|uniref:PQQ-dependent sugar dehydrogenase n=1 Tax=Devosia sp. ZB163 TaxID=3025938 RepID=UPI002360158E|nr:PQQ-dependent sugar dehydrogenase [Devosia sp. ZB163]MDC9825839.1 PQQ-dependent sugar dehydrogenase [Devosia sp. ZB163]
MQFLPALLVTILAAIASPAAAQPVQLATRLVTDGLDMPLFATAPAGDPRLFVLEQTGRIRIVADGALLERPFLDLSGSVSNGNEQGLLGLAFHPDYAENGRFFVNYTDGDGDTQVVAYTVSADANVADPASATTLLTIDQPARNHNGGWLGFGPDGLLYIGMGDGGGAGDRQNRAQNPNELLGKLLRIHVDGATPYTIPPANPYAAGGGAPEIFAIGLRNPWRIDFDGDLIYIADVGQNAQEEIDVIGTADAGANLGWRIMEGDACFQAETCNRDGLVLPIYTYSHDSGGCSITGGYVYRGKAIPELDGHYFFADFCDGRVHSLTYSEGTAGNVTDWTDQLGTPGAITSFGEDSAGELYITTIEGNLLQLVRAE